MWNFLGTIAGITIAFVSVSLDAGAARADAKRYAIMMDALGKSNEVSPQKLEDLEQFLVETGTPRVDAQHVISAVLRAPFLKASGVLQLVPLIRDISAVMGTSIILETDEFLAAFGQNAESAVRYCIGRNALSTTDISKLYYLDHHAHSREALETALTRLQERFTGAYERLRKSE
jgi:hypothetical protein